MSLITLSSQGRREPQCRVGLGPFYDALSPKCETQLYGTSERSRPCRTFPKNKGTDRTRDLGNMASVRNPHKFKLCQERRWRSIATTNARAPSLAMKFLPRVINNLEKLLTLRETIGHRGDGVRCIAN